MAKGQTKKAQNVWERIHHVKGTGQSQYDRDDNDAHPTLRTQSFTQDCWREDLYAKES